MRASLALLATAQAGFLRRDPGDVPPDSDQGVLCSLGPRDIFNGSVEVWLDRRDNSRQLSFSGDGVGAQTAVKCAGEPSPACQPSRGFCADCPCEPTDDLDFGYMRLIAEAVEPGCAGGAQKQMLLVGLGGGALLTRLLGHCPGATVEAIEYDPRVVEVATRFFGVPKGGRSEIETNDGGAAVAARAALGKTYDAVIVDCFAGGGTVPLACRSPAFLDNLRTLAGPGGQVIQQIWSPQFEELFPAYQERFKSVTHRDLSLGVNHLIFATDPRS